MNIEYDYLSALEDIMDRGETITNERTGVGTKALTNVMIEHSDVSDHFPLLISKKVPWKPVIGELLWFLEGSGSDRRLAEITFGDGDHKTIWTANFEKQGLELIERTIGSPYADDMLKHERSLGRVYGVQWRSWRGQPKYTFSGHKPTEIDQLTDLIDRAKDNPSDRRLIVTAWNPADIDEMALPPCHMMFQVNIINGHLDLLMVQRSADMFLGVPFNIASYAALMHILGREIGATPRKLSIVLGNAHIYLNHFDQVTELLNRTDEVFKRDLPTLSINKDAQLFNDDGSIGYQVSDFTVNDYDPLPTIKAPMAV
jgi:thymidylate synthase